MKLEIVSSDRDHAILIGDEDHNDIAEFYHSDHATVGQSYETALALAKQLVAVVNGVAQAPVDCGDVRKVLGAFYKTVDVMKSARNTPNHTMCVWADDMRAIEDVMRFLENLRDRASQVSSTMQAPPAECRFPNCNCPGGPLDPVCAVVTSNHPRQDGK